VVYYAVMGRLLCSYGAFTMQLCGGLLVHFHDFAMT
jgi:hypothetical protein